jgi:pilus assembly protein FimV
LRIEETEVSAAEADAVELLGRLQALEARFNVLLNELDARDRQIASLQAELEVLRQARDAEDGAGALAGMPGAEGGSGTSGPGPSSLDGSDSPAPGSIQAEAFPAQQAQPQGFFATWWPAFAAAGAFLLGLLLASLRSRPAREDEAPAEESDDQRAETARPGTALIGSSMVARPVAIQQPKPVDPLDGVELYVTYGRFAEARAMLDKAIDEDPARLDLRYKQLRVLAELGEASAFEEQEAEILELGGDESRIEQIKDRFPDLFNETDPDMVEQVDQLEPLFDEEDLEDAYDHDEAETTASAPSEGASQLNLNDFTLDPDWDLIEGLNPTPRKSRSNGEAERPIIENDVFESSLHEFPEVEELHADDRDHFPHETESSHKK